MEKEEDSKQNETRKNERKTNPKPTDRWKTGGVALILLMILVLGAGGGNVAAHPAAGDFHQACLDWGTMAFVPVSPLPVVGGTESYHAQAGYVPQSLSCGSGLKEWGSHAGLCPPPTFGQVSIQGALCSNVVANPAQSVTCEWEFVAPGTLYATLGLVVGFDVFPHDGRIDVVLDGPVFGGAGGLFPGDGASLTVQNPHLLPARVIAFPTNMENGDLDPGAIHRVDCV